jgi:hypothetical protein
VPKDTDKILSLHVQAGAYNELCVLLAGFDVLVRHTCSMRCKRDVQPIDCTVSIYLLKSRTKVLDLLLKRQVFTKCFTRFPRCIAAESPEYR